MPVSRCPQCRTKGKPIDKIEGRLLLRCPKDVSDCHIFSFYNEGGDFDGDAQASGMGMVEKLKSQIKESDEIPNRVLEELDL